MEYKIIDPEFIGGYSLTQANNKFGLIDKDGNEILKCEYVVIRYHSLLVPINRILICTNDLRFGLANFKGETICLFDKNISFDDYFNTRYSILPFIKFNRDKSYEVDYCKFNFLNTKNNGLIDKYGNFILSNYNPCIIHQLEDFEHLIIESTAKQDYRYYIVDPKTAQPPLKIQSYSNRLRARTDRLFKEDLGKSCPAFEIESVFDEGTGKYLLKILFEEEDIFIDNDLNLVKKIEYNKFQQIKRAIKFATITKLNKS